MNLADYPMAGMGLAMANPTGNLVGFVTINDVARPVTSVGPRCLVERANYLPASLGAGRDWAAGWIETGARR